MVQFPAICPVCRADSGRQIIPESPEVDTFRCGRCGHEWSEPAAPVRADIPADALPRDGLVLRLKRILGRA
jgi:Zn ribbon nucleic-acid-binding protein